MLAGVNCCDPNGLDRVFAGRLVCQGLRAFRRGGLNRRQQELVALLEPLMSGSSVLDISCGIGAIGTTLLAKGAGRGMFVDVSSAYLNAAREVTAEAGIGEPRFTGTTSPLRCVPILTPTWWCSTGWCAPTLTLRRYSKRQPATASGRSFSATPGPSGLRHGFGRSVLLG